MRRLLLYILPLIVIFSSCSLSKDVNNGRFIQKRKYNKGFHFGAKSSKSKIIPNEGISQTKKLDDEVLLPSSNLDINNFNKKSESLKLPTVSSDIEVNKSLAEKKSINPGLENSEKKFKINREYIKVSKSSKYTLSNEKESKKNAKRAMSASLDVLIYLALCLALSFVGLPLIGGVIYLALRKCSLGAILLNVGLIFLAGVAIFVAVLTALSGMTAGVVLFIILAIALVIGALVQGSIALKNLDRVGANEDPGFYILD